MLYRKFGKTGVEVSALGFGAMRLPVLGGKFEDIDEKTTEAMLTYAIDNGVNYVDTAYVYHRGMSEIVVGKILHDNGLRDKVYLATKLPTYIIPNRKEMDRILKEQLARLKTDHIDFYLMHSLDHNRWSNLKDAGIVDFMDCALKDGRIRHAGFSTMASPRASSPSWMTMAGTLPDTVQLYGYCVPGGPEGAEVRAKKGLGMAIMEPIKGGQLSGVVPDAVQKIWDKADIKRTPAEWALRYVWDRREANVVLSGMLHWIR